ncbi:uncharacterized protein G2W53_030760 [Senna tora]|uniref:Uncharacterized protein n=1 Tax=Senna tora TaxID=362788 RepID=A0A834T822_9FABA|nr:uncharacterized protein G2W53_030760 [Senna tora]
MRPDSGNLHTRTGSYRGLTSAILRHRNMNWMEIIKPRYQLGWKWNPASKRS